MYLQTGFNENNAVSLQTGLNGNTAWFGFDRDIGHFRKDRGCDIVDSLCR